MRKLKVIFLMLGLFSINDADNQNLTPCQPKIFQYSSIVCVCNATYCDEVDNIKPLQKNNFMIFQSTEGGLRFYKEQGIMNETFSYNKNSDFITINTFFHNGSLGEAVLSINRNVKFQKIYGFGGAVTDSVGINMKKLSAGTQERLLRSFYGETGIEFNMIRIPMGSSDFSPRLYVYGDNLENDPHLSNFTLAPEDYEYKIPLIKKIEEISKQEIYIMTASWGAPEWMIKIVRHRRNLIKKYYQLYADYHIRYLQELKKYGVNIWGLSTGNDVFYFQLYGGEDGLGWKFHDQAIWITKHFGPTIRQSEFSKILLFGVDDVRTHLMLWLEEMKTNKKAAKYIDGIALHFYYDTVVPTSVVEDAHEIFPDKIVVQSEACNAIPPWQIGQDVVQLGSWARGEVYFKNILESFNHWYSAWVDWNLCLDFKGGPNWSGNNKDASIIISHENDEFYKQPTFYALGHFSKFIPRGSIRVQVNTIVGNIENVAFLRPDGGIVVVLYNSQEYKRNVRIQESAKGALLVTILPKSFSTIIYW